jgi:hypothetical protein
MIWAMPLLLLLQQAPPTQATVWQTVAIAQPFLGQRFNVVVEGTLPTDPSGDLVLPWLTNPPPGVQVLPPPPPAAMPISLVVNGMSRTAERVATPTGPRWRLAWPMVLTEPPVDVPLRLPAAIMRINGREVARSQTISLSPRALPAPREPLPPWFLGVGPFEVTADLVPTTIALGDEATLTLRVAGAGWAASLVRPRLTDQPGWPTSHLALWPLPAPAPPPGVLAAFAFRLRPRLAGLRPLPELLYGYFDPERESYVTRRVALPAWTIRSPMEAPLPAVALDPAFVAAFSRDFARDPAVPTTPFWERVDGLATNRWVWLVPPAAWLALAAWWRRDPRRTWTAGGRRAWRALRHATSAEVPAILGDYLSARFDPWPVEPAPQQAAELARAAGATPAAAAALQTFLEAVAAARFSPAPGWPEDLKTQAQNVLSALEAQTA